MRGARPREEMSTDLLPCIFAQLFVFKHEMDAAKYRFIELGNPVCRQEHDSVQIFQLTEKYGHKAVA